MAKTGVQIVWYKRDLRVADHRPLAEAACHGPILPLFVAEPALWAEADSAGRHWQFAAESLHELREALGRLGQPLIIRVGEVTEVLSDLHLRVGVNALWSHEETGNGWTYARDQRVGAWCREHGIPWHERPQTGVIRRLKTRKGWAGKWDRLMAEPVTPPPAALQPLPNMPIDAIPTADDLGLAPDACPGRQMGGRSNALDTLESFLKERGRPYRKAMSSPATGFAACSRLSPHLAWGTLSMREAAQATWQRQRMMKTDDSAVGRQWRGALRSFSGRLHWHCHFMQKLEDEPALEHRNLHPAYDGLRPSDPDAARLAAWAAGETGIPFVDACMRCLTHTGWMNFRMRAMLMVFASYHLWLDWRAPGQHLARLFTDFEPGIHWPQVQMQSGTTGINTIRIYNPVKQGLDQDPTGAFTRQWVPELKDVPDDFLQKPWAWPGASSVLGRTYPEPVVDPVRAAKAARDQVWAVRRSQSYRSQANAIQDKHGSRKSGVPVARRGRARKGASSQANAQLDLF